jgi:hypothetical protein
MEALMLQSMSSSVISGFILLFAGLCYVGKVERPLVVIVKHCEMAEQICSADLFKHQIITRTSASK